MTTLVADLAGWREQLTTDHAKDGQPPPTEEEVLGMLVFSFVGDLLDDHWEEITAYLAGTDDEPKFLARLLDEKAAS